MSEKFRYLAHDKEGEVTPDELGNRRDDGLHSAYDKQDVFGAEENAQVGPCVACKKRVWRALD